jgi:hypothetical protein
MVDSKAAALLEQNELIASTHIEVATVADLKGDGNGISDNDMKSHKDNYRLQSSDYEGDAEDDESPENDSLLPSKKAPETVNISPSIVTLDHPHTPKIVARSIFPSEHRPGALAPSLNEPIQPNMDHWPTLACLLRSLVIYITSFFIEEEPAVIEYSTSEIKQRVDKIEVQTQVVGLPGATAKASSALEKVVNIVALVPIGNGAGNQAVAITARPKRVRQLLRNY